MKKLLSTAALIATAIHVYLFFSKNDGVSSRRDTLSKVQYTSVDINSNHTKRGISDSGEKWESQTKQKRNADFISRGKSQECNLEPIDMNEQDTQKRIKKTAQQYLAKMNIDYSGRDVLIEKGDGVIICKFLMPKGILGGDFTVVLDTVTEQVKDAEIQR